MGDCTVCTGVGNSPNTAALMRGCLLLAHCTTVNVGNASLCDLCESPGYYWVSDPIAQCMPCS